MERTAVTGGRVLADPALDERLRRDGFVTFPLLAPTDAARLREVCGEVRGWEGTGFCSDLVVDDPAYRRAAGSAIAAVTDGPVGDAFVDHVPFLRNFLVKFPGADSDLYLHRDWMYVDEREGARTYVAWIALEDVAGHNGQLRVLRGSHELDEMLRGTALTAPWLEHVDVIEPRLLSVPVRAGDCVVFDNRLVHSSFPNHTDRPRAVAAVGLRRAGAPLVHFRRRDERTADRYDVDEDFFCTATPQGLLAAPPDLPVAEVVPVGERLLGPAELAALLDRGALARVDRVAQAVHRGRDGAKRAADAARERVVVARSAASDRTAGVAAAAARIRAAVQRLPKRIDELPSLAAMGVLAVNEAIIDRFGPTTPAVWDPDRFDWARRIEAAYPDVRAEVEALLAGPVEIPHIEDVTGGIPQGNVGPWRSFVLMHQGRWMEWNCQRCPKTTEVVRSIPGLTMAGFSVLEPGTHITDHRGPNKGALRYQLGVIVPGSVGDCRIRVGDEMLVWREGEGVMFDFTVHHEAWNDSDGIRVLLMLEVLTPLPWYLDRPNRLAQHAMGWFPTTRDMAARLRRLEPQLRKAS